jgi:geranylgeranyl diphosphate synthase type I
MRVQAIGGQYLDLAAGAAWIDEAGARRIARLKSGGYTVRFPLAIGADLAEPDSNVHDALRAYGEPLGEAFQLRDDVLGVFGEPEQTGKDALSDLREGKQTILVAKTRARCGEADRAFIDAHIGRETLADADAVRVRRLMQSTGALDETLALIEALADEATHALDRGDLPVPAADALRDLARIVVVRNT